MTDTAVIPPEDMMTEQEKDTAADVPGVGPVTPAEHTTGPVETIEDQGIGPRTPYPTTDAPVADATADKGPAYAEKPTDPFGNPKGPR